MQQKQNGSCCRLLDKIIGTFLRWKSSEPFYKYCVWKIKFSSDLNLYSCSAAFTYQDGWVQGLKHQPGDQRSALQPLPPLAAWPRAGHSMSVAVVSLSLFPVGAGGRILREQHQYSRWIFAGVSCVLSYINKVTRPIMMLTGCSPLVHNSQGLLSSNKSCSSTLCFSEPRSNILLLSQALLSCSGAGRWHLPSASVRTDRSYCRFLHVAATDKQSNDCS